MKKTINLSTINIDGQKLKKAREEKGISATDIAASLTLSRAQIIHIEEGGDKPFYTPAHKLLAVRKYANALDIPYEEVVTGEGFDQTVPVPEDAPTTMRSYNTVNETDHDLSQISATEDRLTAVARNAERRRRILIGGVALCVLIAIYAKMRGATDESKLPQNSQQQEQLSEADPVIEPPVAYEAPTEAAVDNAPVAAAPVANPPAVVAAPIPPVAAAAVPARPAPAAETPTEAKAAKPAVQAETPKPAAIEPLRADAGASDENCAAESGGSDVKSWSPAYQRKTDTRLFVISPKGGTVCVTDNSGKTKMVNLRPMVGEPFTGKPPYTIRSKQLSSLDMYMQGLRVKVPADAKAMRLIPTNVPAPDAESAEASAAD